MLTQQESTHTPVTRRSVLGAALTRRGPRWSRIASNAGAVLLIPGIVGVVLMDFNDFDAPGWYLPVWYTSIGLLALSLMLSLADERWSHIGATAARALGYGFMFVGVLGVMTGASLPWWAALSVYGAAAVIVGAALAGAVANYRHARRADAGTA